MARRPIAVVAAATVLLAGVWAFRPGEPRRDPRGGDLVPRAMPARPPLPVPDAMSDATPMTLLVETRVAGATRYALARVSLDGDEVLVCAPDGRIPSFPTPDAALAWASRVLPRPRDPREAATVAAMGEQLRATPPLAFDLDAAWAWSRDARRDGLPPAAMLGAWTVLAMGAELPLATHGARMAFASGDGDHGAPTDEQALAMSLMKVDLIVGLAQRRRGTMDAATWPAEREVWSDADARRIARELERAIPSFAARLTDDVDAVERALRSAHGW
jgi:hypothetical protein